MNKYAPHVYVIPEDDRDRQIADGFVSHHKVDTRQIKVMPIAGGWGHVIKTFADEYVQIMREYQHAYVVMLIDFDGQIDNRMEKFNNAIPEDIKSRVFVVGSSQNPEALKRALKMSFEGIGQNLANDCDARTAEYWNHEQLQHNNGERQRLFQLVRPFLFKDI
jgi:hypothetical protein